MQHLQRQDRRRLSRRSRIFIISLIATVMVIVLIMGILGVVPAVLGVTPTIWVAIVLAVLTVLSVVLAVVPLLPADSEQQGTPPVFLPASSPASPASPPIQITNVIQLPSSQQVQTLAQPPSSPTALPISMSTLTAPPLNTDPRTTEQREAVVQQVYAQLLRSDITALVLIGIGGLGKSTLAALVFQHAKSQGRAHTGPFQAEPLWFTVNANTDFLTLAGNLCQALDKPIPEASFPPQSQAYALLNALNTVEKPRLIVLDQFENMLDWKTGQALNDRPGVGELIDALNTQTCACRVLLTSRPVPKGTYESAPTRLQEYRVDKLTATQGRDLLRKQGVNEEQATEAQLQAAVERCDGHALALTLLTAILRNNRSLTMKLLFHDPHYTSLWGENIARRLLDYIYIQQLDQVARDFLLSFSVYREAVPLNAALTSMQTQPTKGQGQASLDMLRTQHLLQDAGNACYQLHSIVSSYAQTHFDTDEQRTQVARQAAHAKAAHYYLQLATQSGPEQEQRRRVTDVHPLTEAVWHFCQAGRWQEAYAVMDKEQLFFHLELWGGNALLLELCQLLLSEDWHTEALQTMNLYHYMVSACNTLGKKQQAIKYAKDLLTMSRKEEDRGWEGATLSNLGVLYDDLGQKQEALQYYQEALAIRREVGGRRGEGATLNGLGSLYKGLGQKQEALQHYQDALAISREVGDRTGEGTTLWNIGALWFEQKRYSTALACLLLAQHIFEEVQSPNRQSVQEWIDDLRREVGDTRFNRMIREIGTQVQSVVDVALQHPLQENEIISHRTQNSRE